jgi:hypothetical protein
MHTIQDIDCVILVMFNQSNAITCLKYKNVRPSFWNIIIIIFMYLKNLNLLKNKATHSGSSSILKRDQFFDSVLMTIPK